MTPEEEKEFEEKLTPEEKEEFGRLGLELLHYIHISAIRNGDLKLSDDWDTVSRYFDKYRDSLTGDQFPFTQDHQPSLLKRARTFKREFQNEESILFYATWFEHWINGIMLPGFYRNQFTQKDFKEFVRGTSLKIKYSYLPKLLGFPPINQRHISTVLETCDLRNAYVHYKFPRTDDSKDNDWYMALFNRIEKTIKYLKQYENKVFFDGHSPMKLGIKAILDK
ncbi:hypothetical protein P4C99_21540 [Pontiellaceae bacterium B1224]|nr:hypothetical protein [Pontiellaceae bacterium B1224]